MGDPVSAKQDFVTQELGGKSGGAVPAVHRLLAEYPLPVYLTTNYDDFMRAALCDAGKEARAELPTWWRSGGGQPATGPAPSAGEPVVYHLHGLHDMPESLVLTEDDYIHFLISLVEDRDRQPATLLPPFVREALASRPLLFIGYSLRDWTFRVLFEGLLKAVPPTHQRRHISVQLDPLSDGVDPADQAKARQYLERHFDGKRISIHWSSAEDFVTELRVRLAATP
ncbi:SIR2 family protein [Nonomuraea sp. NBC_01738]|nr:SIR2 family protein [Nonomuraea sp. NBC_01738]